MFKKTKKFVKTHKGMIIIGGVAVASSALTMITFKKMNSYNMAFGSVLTGYINHTNEKLSDDEINIIADELFDKHNIFMTANGDKGVENLKEILAKSNIMEILNNK